MTWKHWSDKLRLEPLHYVKYRNITEILRKGTVSAEFRIRTLDEITVFYKVSAMLNK